MKRIMLLVALVFGLQAAAFALPAPTSVNAPNSNQVKSAVQAGKHKIENPYAVSKQKTQNITAAVKQGKPKKNSKDWFDQFNKKFKNDKGPNAKPLPLPLTADKAAPAPTNPPLLKLEPAQTKQA